MATAAKTVKSTDEVLESPEFRRLVAQRWTVSALLTGLLFILYYGYIVLMTYSKPLFSREVGDYATLGIPLGILVIAFSWVLMVVYVIWANGAHDPAVKKLRDQLR